MTRPLPIALLLLALLASGGDALGQDGWQSVSAPQLWHDYSPQGSTDGQGIYHEVLSRCTAEGRQRMYDPDPVTWCHEATHEVNSRIRNAVGGNVNGFYVGKGKCAILAEPRVTLATVAQYVAPEKRTSAFNLYLVQAQRDWNNQPLYILDEYSAYINGAQACRELGGARSPASDDMHCNEFSYFADCLVAAVRQHDPNYVQLDQLVEFINHQKYRIRYMRGQRSDGQQVAQSCIDGQCFQPQQGYRVIHKPLQPQQPSQPTQIKPASFEDPRWVKWRLDIEARFATCKGQDGRDGVDGKDGRDGIDGKDGLNGKDGAPGTAQIDYDQLAANIDVKQVINNLDVTAIATAIAAELPSPEEQAVAIQPFLEPIRIRQNEHSEPISIPLGGEGKLSPFWIRARSDQEFKETNLGDEIDLNLQREPGSNSL